MLAKQIMRKRVVTVGPDMTLRELAKVFADRHISGAPVVDRNGKLVGVVSQTDLIRNERDSSPSEISSYHKQTEDELAHSRGMHYEIADYTRVSDVMTPWVISFEEDTPIQDVARHMLRRRIHRIVVTRDGMLRGIVSSMDLMKALIELVERDEPAMEKS